jgi:hypothetical protein
VLTLLALPACRRGMALHADAGCDVRKSTNFRDLALGKEERHRNYGLAVSRFGEGSSPPKGLSTITPSFFRGSDPVFETWLTAVASWR